MKRYQIIWTSLMIFVLAIQMPLRAHEGHVHGAEEHEAAETLLMSRTEVQNERYELLLKFSPVEPGDSLEMHLFVSDYKTNMPVQLEHLTVMNMGLQTQGFEVVFEEKGIYAIKTIMPEEIVYDYKINIQVEGQRFSFDLKGVDFAHHHVGAATPHEHSHFWMYIGGAGVLLLGLLLGRFTATRKYQRASIVLVLLIALPITQIKNASAHEGHDLAPSKKAALPGNHFELAKESQFLMQIYTTIAGESAYQDGRKLYGTIIPSSGGQSNVVLPQHGRLTQLNVRPGDRVAQGTILAIVERSVDPVNEILIAAERNRLVEEVDRLKLEYERLRQVSDIVSKREIEVAETAYHIAKSNLELYQSNGSNMTIKSPIDGIVSPFTYQVGDLINGGVDLFTISNIGKVYVETQAFEKDIAMIEQATSYLVQCSDGNHSTTSIRLLSLGTSFNSANQSQRVLFEIDNTNGDFKLGEFVNVWTYAATDKLLMSVPNSAITELQGRPVVFVKHTAENLELRYVAMGQNNGQSTILENGLKQGERYVTDGAYQCKLVYLNQ